MSPQIQRRELLLASAATLAPSLFGLQMAQAQTASGVLRVGMTVGAVPSANDVPDQGGEGARFMNITLYDQLVAWDLSQGDKPAGLIPCLATAWKPDATRPKRWNFTLREGVRFHDGHELALYRKYLDDDEFAFLRNNIGKRASEWPPLIAQVQGAMDAGRAPDSPEVQALARHWFDLFRSFAGDSPATQQKVRQALVNEPGLTDDGFVTPAMRKFMRAAMMAAADNRGKFCECCSVLSFGKYPEIGRAHV